MKTGRLSSAVLLAATLLLASLPAAARDGIIDSEEELQKVRIGVTTSAQLAEIAGKPLRLERFPRKGVESWNYSMRIGGQLAEIAIEIDDKGIVRSIERVKRWGP